MENDLEKLAWEWMTAKPGQAQADSEYYCQTRDVFQARVDRLVKNLLDTKDMDEEYAYIISAMAGEIGNNSFDHNLGKWPDVAGIFFGYNLSEKLEIILADRGQGILATLKKVKPELENDSDALETAFLERISGRAPERRGNGLKFVKENIETKKMHLTFISGNAKAELNDEMKITETEKSITGCLAIITL
jgi:hypothetical protein